MSRQLLTITAQATPFTATRPLSLACQHAIVTQISRVKSRLCRRFAKLVATVLDFMTMETIIRDSRCAARQVAYEGRVSHFPIRSPTRSLTHSLTHSAHTLAHFTHVLRFSLTHPLARSIITSLPHSLPLILPHSLTPQDKDVSHSSHSLPPSLTHSWVLGY